MNAKIVILGLLGILLVFGICSVATGDGGGPDPTGACANLPQPTPSSPLLEGFFTASYDKSDCSIANPDCRHYIIQVVLDRRSLMNGKELVQRHLFSFFRPVSNTAMCDFTDGELEEKYKIEPCMKEVGKAFNLTGTPVLTEVSVLKRDFCCDQKNSMLYGTVKIRVVP